MPSVMPYGPLNEGPYARHHATIYLRQYTYIVHRMLDDTLDHVHLARRSVQSEARKVLYMYRVQIP